MPGKVKVKIIAGRNLPVMDRSSDTTDAYVEIKLGNTTYKTDVCRKSLNPQWNSEWYRFEVDDSELQDEPLQIRLMDHDTYSANDAIGKVYLNLNPLLIPAVAIPSKYGWTGDTNLDQPSSSMMSGWIPVYDTMHGIRGEVNITVKVELFSDFNKFRQSSCGVQFFCSPVIPHGYHAQVIHGFIEELVVNDDPEYQWIDKIRTPRASNEARQTLFFKLSGELQRKIGVKALDLGGNAVIGYNQCFDLEGESGIVARGIGTVVSLVKHHEMQQQLTDIGIAEEKALSYLKFLAFDNGLKLENDNTFERLSQPFLNPLPSSLLNPLEETRRSPRRNIPLFIRQSSQPLIQLDYHSPILKPCISSRSLTDDVKEEMAIRQLILQEDMRNGSISTGSLTRKIRILKPNILSKKMIALKAKLSDTTMPENLDLGTSSISKEESAPIRTSLIDLRELRKKKKSRMHQKNSSYMAELLVRSVMHAHTSLDCILECHDTGSHLSSSTSRLNEDLGEGSSHQTIEIKNKSHDCETVGGMMSKTISEPYLLLPDSSIVSASSNASSDSDVSSSSDVTESPSDSKEDNFDTVSLIVKNVQEEEERQEHKERKTPTEICETLHFSYLDPPVHTSKDITEEEQDNITIIEETPDVASPLPTFNKNKLSTLFRSHALNISFDVPATAPVYLEDSKELFNFPVDIDKKIEKLSHSALFNKSFRMHGLKRAKLKKGLSRSCEDITIDSTNEKVEKNKNIALHLFDQAKPDNKSDPTLKRKNFAASSQKTFSQSNPNINEVGLVKTAISTMLMEKINLMTSESAPVSPIAKEELRSPGHSNPDLGNKSLVKTAMETMLMEKVNLMTPSKAPLSFRIQEQFQSSVSKSFSRSDPDLHSHSLLKNAMHTIHKVHLPHHLFHHKAKKLDKSLSQSHPELSHHHSVKEKIMDTIHSITHHKSKEFDQTQDESHSPEISEHHTVKEKIMDTIHSITHHKSKEFDQTQDDCHSPEISEHHTVKEKIMDTIHSITHHKSKEFDQTQDECHSPEISEHHTVKEKIMDTIHSITHHKPKETDQIQDETHTPEISEHHTVKEIIMDTIHSITHHKPKESEQVHEESHSTDNSDSSHSEHHSMKDKLIDTFHSITHHKPKENEHEETQIASNSEHHTVKEILMDTIHSITHHKSKESDHHTPEETQSVTNSEKSHSEHHSVKEKFMDKIHFITHVVPHHKHESSQGNLTKLKTLSTSHPELMEHHTVKEKFMDKIHFLTHKIPHHKQKEFDTQHVKEISKSNPDLHDHEKHKHSTYHDIVHALKAPIKPIIRKRKDTSHSTDESELGDHSLIKTAMQTMLLDKINILTPPVSPKSTMEFPYPELSTPKIHQIDEDTLVLTPSHVEFIETPQTSSEYSSPDLSKKATTPPIAHQEDDFKTDGRKFSIKHEHHNLDKIKTVVHSVMEKVHHISPLSPKSEKEFHFDVKKTEDMENQSLMKTAMQTMLLDKVQILAPNSPSPEEFDTNEGSFEFPAADELKEDSLVKTAMETILIEQASIVAPESTNIAHEIPSEVKKKSSFLGTIKRKCKNLKLPSPRKSISRLMHKKDKDSPKGDGEGMIESAMSTILLDRANNMQGILSSNDEIDKPIVNPFDPNPKAFSNENIDKLPLALSNAEEPNINLRLDSGVSSNLKTPAITADYANCDTNAEHAPCLYTSDRRIVESPVPERERDRDRERDTSIKERTGHQRTESTGGKMSQSPARLNAIPCIHRRSSDSDLSITPKGNSLTGSDRSGGAIPGYHHIRNTLLRPTVDNFDMMEYPFLTMAKYPPGFILHLGGAVSARSVKLLERITNIEEPETRDTWWSELRMEIRTHARALNCNAVLGYQESTSICDEVCVLSASGTAAVIAVYSGELSDGVSGLPNLHKPHVPNKDLMTSSLDRTDFEKDSKNSKHSESSNTNNKITESPEQEATIEFSGSTTSQQTATTCRICHIPYSESSMSFRINMLYCSICKLAKVPDIILATIEIPEGLPITGRGCFLQSYVCRPKRDLKGELNAKEISESLPFLEYELHRLLVNKMKVKAMNTIFGLKVRITIGERMLVGVATGTAVFLLPLPPPPLPKLIAGNATTEDKKLAEMQQLLVKTVKENKEIYELKEQEYLQNTRLLSDTEESDDEKSNLDLSAGNKDSCVLEVDDSEDIEVINLLVEKRPPDGFHVVNTENVPGLEELEIVRNLQMFTQVWRAKIPINQSASHFGKHFQKLLQSVYFKLRRMIPCALCDLQFRVDLPEPDEIQLTLLGMALGLGDPMKLSKFKRKNISLLPNKEYNKKSDDELIFSLEEDHIPENSVPIISQGGLLNPQMPKLRQKSPQRLRISTKQRHTPIKERHGVDITPLSYVPGGKIERYLGYLNFFFIRETTSIREGGGLSGFVHSFITEVLAIVRAHVTALGGNAMVAYFMTECVLYHNAHKNQGQCLINVGGDVVFVSYFSEDN